MSARAHVAMGPGVVGLAAIALAACGSAQGSRPAATSNVATREHQPHGAAGRCPTTTPAGGVEGVDEGFNHGDRSLAVALWPHGRLVAGRLPDGAHYAEVEPDGSISAKLGWWRGVGGRLVIEGKRLDASAPALRADVPGGYGPTGFQPTRLTFPTPGCWEVVGRSGRATLTFVVLVREP